MSEAVDDPTADDPVAPGDESVTDQSQPTTEPAEPIAGDDGNLDVIDLVGIEADLDGVQAALVRLADGTYWTDEVTGEPISADVLAADPLARRA